MGLEGSEFGSRNFRTPIPPEQLIIEEKAYFRYHKVAGNDQGS